MIEGAQHTGDPSAGETPIPADRSGSVSRRNFIKASLAGAAMVGSGCVPADESASTAAHAAPVVAAARGKRLNVIQVILHDAGQHFGCYGQKVSTPGIDALAAQGAIFTNHFCNSTPCSPARGCVMTGQYAHRNGLIGLVNKGWDIPPHTQTLVDRMNDAGYETVRCGLQHERHPRNRNAMRYQKNFATRGSKDPERRQISVERVTAAAKLYLKARDATRPLYLNMGVFETHAPWTRRFYKPFAPKPEDVAMPAFLPDVPVIRKGYAAFLGALSYTDSVLGDFFRFLDDSGLEADTAMIFTADHGDATGSHRHFEKAGTMYDEVYRVPLIVQPPAGPRGVEVRQFVRLMDLMPTIVELAGADAPESIDGRSLTPLMTGRPPDDWPDAVYCEHHGEVWGLMTQRMVRTHRWKYVFNPHDLDELYDLSSDPAELTNLIDSRAHDDVLSEMKARLMGWNDATGDVFTWNWVRWTFPDPVPP
ncbi:hypothetical protein LCGC14_2095610, partial [marine sediment metagenome]